VAGILHEMTSIMDAELVKCQSRPGVIPVVLKTASEEVCVHFCRSRGRYATPACFPLHDWYPVPGATRTPLGFGICPSFKGRSLSCRANLKRSIRKTFSSLYVGGGMSRRIGIHKRCVKCRPPCQRQRT
jgi:hypothetical protein